MDEKIARQLYICNVDELDKNIKMPHERDTDSMISKHY